MLAMAIPGTASADVWPTNWQWQNPTYYGYDDYYGQWVNEYAEGATATLPVFLWNTGYYAYGDATIKSATLKMDWGLEVAGTGVPAVLPYNEGAVIQFSFTVPSVSVATNAWTHSYEVVIEYETDSYQHKVNFYPWDYMGNGNGAQTAFGMDVSPVVPNSQKVFLVDGAAGTVTEAATTAYSVNYASGVVTFNTAPAVGISVYSQYTYMEYVDQGDGETTVFWLNDSPIAPDSEVIYLYNTVSNSIALVANTAYTLDDETGRIVFNTAPRPYEYVYASYDIYESSSWYTTWGSDDFVVLSADQSAWYGLEQKYSNMDNWFGGFNSTAARSLGMEAEYNDDLAWDAYYAGNFATARSFQQIAVDKLQAAIDAEVAYNKGWEDREIASDSADLSQQLAYVLQIESQTAENIAYTANVPKEGLYTDAQTANLNAETANVAKEGSYLDAQTAYLNAQTAHMNAMAEGEKALLEAQAKQAKGLGAFYTNTGVFMILSGVGGLLFSIALILWAYSRLVAAKGPKQI
jgi:hypothetical protein